ncbi:hypothetical protein [Halopelagius fulvigenes]|uniref:Uncharacterized protein n=1 Tax=Halopelagius fulvigenes TaxID=1198324 RepID=A0ABD5TYH2_9EURY
MSTFIVLPVGERKRGEVTIPGPAVDIGLDYVGFVVSHPELGEAYAARTEETVPDSLTEHSDVSVVTADEAATFLSDRLGEEWTAADVRNAFQIRR